MVCCIKKFPLTALSSCGATATEVAEVLNGVKVLNEATQPAVDEAADADGAEDAATEEDDPDHGWRQHCMDTYVACKDQKGWVGDCYACFRYCKGQHQRVLSRSDQAGFFRGTYTSIPYWVGCG